MWAEVMRTTSILKGNCCPQVLFLPFLVSQNTAKTQPLPHRWGQWPRAGVSTFLLKDSDCKYFSSLWSFVYSCNYSTLPMKVAIDFMLTSGLGCALIKLIHRANLVAIMFRYSLYEVTEEQYERNMSPWSTSWSKVDFIPSQLWLINMRKSWTSPFFKLCSFGSLDSFHSSVLTH